jgi:hypothetical protein
MSSVESILASISQFPMEQQQDILRQLQARMNVAS